MGAGMVGTLQRAGFDVVAYNRTRGAAEATGAEVADSARQAVAGADITISSLADDDALTAVYSGPDGVLAGLQTGAVAIDTSTVKPATIQALAPLVAAKGASFIDAPVSGSVGLVEAGQLTVMVGGDLAALELARLPLDALASKIFHVGPIGSGATVKLAVNALVHATNTALSEAIVLAEKSGVDRALAYEVFASGAAGSPFLQYKKEAYLHPEAAPVAFSLDLVAKDLRLILTLADQVGAPMEQGAANLEVTEAAIRAGLGERDMSIIAEHLRA
jgi:3-hydroxyisobutyrate dehydrogenase/2-hydroxy-3-oxopropionate reductase